MSNKQNVDPEFYRLLQTVLAGNGKCLFRRRMSLNCTIQILPPTCCFIDILSQMEGHPDVNRDSRFMVAFFFALFMLWLTFV